MPLDDQAVQRLYQKLRLRMAYNGDEARLLIAAQVGIFLKDPANYKPFLDKLSRKIDEEFEKRLSASDIYKLESDIDVELGQTRTTLRHDMWKIATKQQRTHVVTAVLARKEIKNGFVLGMSRGNWYGGGRNPAPLLLTGFVNPQQFRNNISEGKPFKDPMVPGGHGEYSHRIQWWLLMHKDVKSLLSLRADFSWSNLYRWIGTIKHRNNAFAKAELNELGLWDAIFDRNKKDRDDANGPYNTKHDGDFRSPENLHYTVTVTYKGEYPILASFLSGREIKRAAMRDRQVAETEQQFEDRYDQNIKDYVAKKVFDRRDGFNNLSLGDQQRVQDVLNQKMYMPIANQDYFAIRVMSAIAGYLSQRLAL